MKRFGFLVAVAVLCCGLAAPAYAGGGGSSSGKSGGSKGNITVNVKNVGSVPMGASVQSGTPAFPSTPSAYKELASGGGTGNFSVKSGTFSLFGVAGSPLAPVIQKSFSSTSTAYIHADAGSGLATQVSASQF